MKGPCLPRGRTDASPPFPSRPVQAPHPGAEAASACAGGRCAAGTRRPEGRRWGGGGSGSRGRAEGRIPGCEVAAPAPGPAPPPARGGEWPCLPPPRALRGRRALRSRARTGRPPSTPQPRGEGAGARWGRRLRDSDRPAASAQSRCGSRVPVPRERGRRGGGAAPGEVATLPLSPALPLGPAWPSRGREAAAPRAFVPGPVAPPVRGARVSGSAAGEAALRREPRTAEVARGGGDPAAASGSAGREAGLQTKLLLLCPLPSYLWAERNPDLPRVPPTPPSS